MGRLVIDLDPAVWLLGPSADLPLERWLPVACEHLADRFDFSPDDAEAVRHVEEVLTATGRLENDLSHEVVHWADPTSEAVPVLLGLQARSVDTDGWLRGVDLEAADHVHLDESPVLHEGGSMRRSVMTSEDEGGQRLTSARYVVDTGDVEAVVVARVTSDDHDDLMRVEPDVVAMLRTVRVTGGRSRRTLRGAAAALLGRRRG